MVILKIVGVNVVLFTLAYFIDNTPVFLAVAIPVMLLVSGVIYVQIKKESE